MKSILISIKPEEVKKILNGEMVIETRKYSTKMRIALQGLFDYMTTEEMDKNMHSLESLKKSIENIGNKLGEINGTWKI